jgi:hypothetical protein
LKEPLPAEQGKESKIAEGRDNLLSY